IPIGADAAWRIMQGFSGIDPLVLRFLLASLCGLGFGAIVAALVELVLIRPLYQRHIEQVLVTVGLGLAVTALTQAIWTPTQKLFVMPHWLVGTTTIGGAHIPNDRWVEISAAVVVLVGLVCF